MPACPSSLSRLDVSEVGRLKVRIGIATGLVVVSFAEKGAVGETMNLASRLQGIAHPGSVVVTQRVHGLAGGVFDYEDLGEQTLKGIGKPARAYRIVGVSDATSRFEAATQEGLTPLVGREQDLGLLMERWALAQGLLVDDPRGCGLSTRVAPDAGEAYFVVHYSCAAITVSIAHEIGHILGVRHDRLEDSSNSPFSYGHGYVNGTKWRDIMSYAESCDGCLRVPYWSNPRVLYKGEPMGTLTEDAARVILEQAERVSHFR